LRVTAAACHIRVMLDHPPRSEPTSDPLYRLVVSASGNRARQFIWQIVDDHNHGKPVHVSTQMFRSMEDAYHAGKGAFEYWRAKMRRATSSTSLAQSSPGPSTKKADRVQVSHGLLTSGIYSRR
jgi:hypothetical protein